MADSRPNVDPSAQVSDLPVTTTVQRSPFGHRFDYRLPPRNLPFLAVERWGELRTIGGLAARDTHGHGTGYPRANAVGNPVC